jgi:catechol 2,3-dioxygenase-like lactoylglutathione lyase family enzyme
MKTFLVSSVAVAGFVTAIGAQAPVSQFVLGPGNFLHVVADAERAITFYRDALGMDVQMPANVAPQAGPRPFLTTPEIVKLYNATGGRYRTATAFVQGSPMRAELIEWQDVDRKAFIPRHADPGAGTMIITVRDLDATLARVKAAGATVVSVNAAPVVFTDERGRGRAVMVQDLDGFHVQLVQRDTPPATTAPADRNAIDVGFAASVDDMDRSLRIFNGALGFNLTLDTEEHNDARLRMIGNFTAYYRRAVGVVPGSNLQMEVIEVQGTDRRHGHSRPQDPGTSILRLRVSDIDKAVEALALASAKVVSTGGVPVTLAGANGSQRFAILELPDNLFLQLVQAIPRQ